MTIMDNKICNITSYFTSIFIISGYADPVESSVPHSRTLLLSFAAAFIFLLH